MALPLRSGDPPAETDCVDIGSLDVSGVFSNNPGSEEAGNIQMRDMYGSAKSDWAVVRKAITQVRRKYDHPVRAKIPGLGHLHYHEEGWEVV